MKTKKKYENQQITYKGIPISLLADFSAENLQARREWHYVFKVMKGKNLQPRILYPARLSFRFDGEIKSFTDKQKLREFSAKKTTFTTNAKGTSLDMGGKGPQLETRKCQMGKLTGKCKCKVIVGSWRNQAS